MTLADPDQFLNAWQFYYPPGPPPSAVSPDDFDAEGSEDLTETVSDSSAQTDTKTDVNIATAPQIAIKPEIHSAPEPVVTVVSTRGSLQPQIEQPVKPIVKEEIEQPVSPIVKEQTTTVKSEEKVPEVKTSSDQEVATSNDTPKNVTPVIATTKSEDVKHKEEVSTEATKVVNDPSVPRFPPDFKPRFEDGGWTPLEGVPGLL